MLGKGADIYVLGASRMMDYVSPSFFVDKISIGCNYLYQRFPVTYTITRHIKVVQDWQQKQPDTRLVCPRFTSDLGGIYVGTPDIELPHDVFWSRSIIGSAIDFARWLGAKSITILGVEFSNDYMSGYKTMQDEISTAVFNETNRNQTTFIIDYIKLKYKIPVKLLTYEEVKNGHFSNSYVGV